MAKASPIAFTEGSNSETRDIGDTDFVSVSSVDSFQMVVSPDLHASDLNAGSWTVLPFDNATPRCFLPTTIFIRKKDGKKISAAELHGEGGEWLLAPGNTEVLVLKSRRHKAEERRFITLETASGKIEVTDDHRVLVRGLDGLPMDMRAGHIQPIHAMTGSGYQLVKHVYERVQTTEVVEVILQDDAPVLCWERSSRRFGHPDASRAFAVRGGQWHATDQAVITPERTFWNMRPAASGWFRSRSAGSSITKLQQRRLARSRGSEWAHHV